MPAIECAHILLAGDEEINLEAGVLIFSFERNLKQIEWSEAVRRAHRV